VVKPIYSDSSPQLDKDARIFLNLLLYHVKSCGDFINFEDLPAWSLIGVWLRAFIGEVPTRS